MRSNWSTTDQEAATARRLIAGKVRATRGQLPVARVRKLMGVLARKGYGATLAYRVVCEALEAEGAARSPPTSRSLILTSAQKTLRADLTVLTWENVGQKPSVPGRHARDLSPASLLKTLSTLNLTAARCYSALRG